MEKFWKKSIQNSNLENIKKKDKPKGVESFSQKEVESAMDITKKEIELKEATEQWVNKISFQFEERAKSYGLENSVGKTIIDFRDNIARERREIINKNIKELKKKSVKTIINLFKGKEKEKLQDLANQSLESKKSFIDLLIKKLKEGVTPEQKQLLNIFAHTEKIKKERLLGQYDPLTKKIRIPLLNPQSLKENSATAMHEFTHSVLDVLVGKKVRSRKAVFSIMKEETKEQKLTKFKGEENFFKTMKGINEALAFTAGKYYGEKNKPNYEAYKDETSPKIFKEFYEQINESTEGKSLQEFDKFAAHLYSSYTNKWKENMTMEDLLKIVKDTTKEIIKFKK